MRELNILGAAAATALLGGCVAAEAPRSAGAAGRCGAPSRPLVAQDALARQLDGLLSAYEDYGLAGSVLVARGGEVILSKGYGPASVEAGTPNGPTTLYDMGSLAKTFTAAAILDLEAQGRLSVQDAIGRFFPELPEDKRAITIHQLLTHTAGLALDLEDLGGRPSDTTGQLLQRIGAGRLRQAPGAAYAYSNVGYGLLALIVERAAGRTWQAQVRDRLIRPARLDHTYLYGEALPRRAVLASAYLGDTNETARLQDQLRPGASPLMWGGKYTLGSVGVLTTVGDLHRWWCALRSERLLPEPQRGRLFAIQAADQGYGWNIARSGETTSRISRGGLRGAYQSLIAYYPASDTLLVFALNRNVGGNLWAEVVWNNLAKAVENRPYEVPPRLVSLRPDQISAHAGRYLLPGGGAVVLRDEGGVLHAGIEGQGAIDALLHAAGNRPPELERTHAASLALIRALAAGDRPEVERLSRMSAEQAGTLAGQWAGWASRIGGFRDVELLGSTRGGATRTRTFVRLSGPAGAQAVRLLWEAGEGRLLAWGDEIPLPGYARLWPTSENAFVSYDLRTGQSARFTLGADGTVVVSTPRGEAILSGRR